MNTKDSVGFKYTNLAFFVEYFKERHSYLLEDSIFALDTSIMPDIMSTSQRSHCMASIHSVATKPEMLLRKHLWREGLRYHINDRRLPGSPDIVLPKFHTAIFVHGCFWHGHKDCKYYTIPKTNTDFWKAKVARNQERDQKVWRQLEAKGWFVIIVWECQLKKAHLAETVEAVAKEIRHNGELYLAAKNERRKAQEAYQAEQRAKKEKEAALLSELYSKQ